MLVGTYTDGESKGIYIFRMDGASGRLSPSGYAPAVHPSFLAVHPTHPFVYAVGETNEFEGRRAGSVSAFAFDRASGRLERLNSAAVPGGTPCHLIVDARGRYVLVANYAGGNVAVLPVEANGAVGEPVCVREHSGSSVNPERQARPHPHAIYLDAENRFAFVPDLGIDRVAVYAFDENTGELSAVDSLWAGLRPGAGPRHMAFHPELPYAYVINELDSTITVFGYEAAGGRLTPVQTVSTLPDGFAGENWPAEVLVHPSGAFVYGSNRGHDSIAAFRVDRGTGRLLPIGHAPTQGKWPRNFAIDPSGRRLFAENQNSGTIVEFAIQPDGTLRPTGQVVSVPSPACIKFVPC